MDEIHLRDYGISTGGAWDAVFDNDKSIYFVGEEGGYGSPLNGMIGKLMIDSDELKFDWSSYIQEQIILMIYQLWKMN